MRNKDHSRPKNRIAQAPVEIAFALITAICCILPLYLLYGGESAANPRLTEMGLYAEILSTRILEDCSAWPWDKLENAEGKVDDRCLEQLFRNDKRDDWYIAFKEYRRKLGVGKDKFRAKRLVRRVADGLMAIEVIVSWRSEQDPRTGSPTFSLFRLRARDHESMRRRKEVKL